MAETIVNIVLGKLADVVVQEALSLYGVRDKVERVQRELTWIQSFLKDADTKRHKNERVKKWVNEVQEVGYLIEDTIEKFLVEVGGGRTEGLQNVLKRIGKMPMKLVKKHKLGNQLDQIQQRICEISENRIKYGIEGLQETSGGASVEQPIRPFVNPDIDETEVVGFLVDKKIIVDQLIDTNNTRRAVISIVGAPGSGKTTLATDVYKSVEVKRHFDISMWLTISQEYKLMDILIKMLEKNRNVLDSERQNKEEEYFIIELNKSMKERKYLIVLDDIWSNNLWADQLQAALPDDHNGSRVLITTRFIQIAEEADIISNPYKIKPLNEEESKQLLLKKVFPNRFANECSNEVLPLATEFTKKCGGWPLPLVVLGGILSRKNPDYHTWNDVMQKMDWHIDGGRFMGVISTSYEDLPTALKPCFMYFGVFPEDYQIDATTLIRLWIAEGFIQQEGTKVLEDIADNYLEELVQRCMVQVSRRFLIGKIQSCHIHDLLRDLAIQKAKENNFLTVVSKNIDTTLSCSTCARRVALHDCEADEMIEHACKKNIRSVINFAYESKDIANFNRFRNLRVFHSRKGSNKPLQGTNNLKGLKYFAFGGDTFFYHEYDQCSELRNPTRVHFWGTFFKRSPLTYMKNLQTVNTFFCKSHGELPLSFWSNKQLRNIDFFSCFKCRAIPEGPPSAADLQSLLTLGRVRARQDWVIQLPNFLNIRELMIVIPEDVEVEPLINLLSKLNHLSDLNLKRAEDNPLTFPDCISAFRNHNRLHSFTLLFGKWPKKEVGDCTIFPPHLVQLILGDVSFEKDPMPQLEKLPKLRALIILRGKIEAASRKQMICSKGGFGGLQNLVLEVDDLEEWKIEEGAMPMLNQLQLTGCEKLQIVPDLQYLAKLQEFTTIGCSDEFKSKLQGEDQWKIKHIPSVKYKYEFW